MNEEACVANGTEYRITPFTLVVRNLIGGYSGSPVVKGVSLEIRSGEILGIIGANGSGKSTLLRLLHGLLTPYSGEVLLNGQPVQHLPPHHRSRKSFMMIPQGKSLFPKLTLRENLFIGLGVQAGEERKKLITRVIEVFPAIAPLLDKRAELTSGGEQQMAALGRAIISNSDILLLDEPSLGLAPRISSTVARVLKTIVVNQKRSIVLVEHNQMVLRHSCDRLVGLKRGNIVAEGLPSTVLSSQGILEEIFGV